MQMFLSENGAKASSVRNDDSMYNTLHWVVVYLKMNIINKTEQIWLLQTIFSQLNIKVEEQPKLKKKEIRQWLWSHNV